MNCIYNIQFFRSLNQNISLSQKQITKQRAMMMLDEIRETGMKIKERVKAEVGVLRRTARIRRRIGKGVSEFRFHGE